ncbi:ABC transporter permease [Limisalsivibrio acetivorans]|uniref:ABC transporter permease n=1 Tax=Limisalsivibrio acetivorans TaxID=1304888 RepID=UPI0003B6624B|nr:ABC transporter permease [Limisalsivibrio acetivorans]
MRIKVEKRLNTSKYFGITAPLMSVFLSLVTAGIIMIFAGINPLAAYYEMLTEALGTFYGISETLVKATPLIIAGLGISIAFRMQLWNIGAEGQLVMGAIGSSIVGLYSGIESEILLLAAMLGASFLFGGMWALVSGFLKAKYRVNEIIVTLLMNYIAISVLSWLIYGPMKDPMGFNFPHSQQLADSARLAYYFDTRLHTGFIIALVLVVLIHIFMEKTVYGYEIRVIGDNPSAAKYAGMNIPLAVMGTMFLSGAIAGIAGFSEFAGVQYRLQESISIGYGYTAIIVAWLARRSAFGVLFVSLIMGVLLVGGDSLQITWQLPVAFINLFQGLILFFVLSSDFFMLNRVRLVRDNND